MPKGTQITALAGQVGTDRVWLWRVLTGRGTPSVDLARRIEKATAGAIRWTDFFAEDKGAA